MNKTITAILLSAAALSATAKTVKTKKKKATGDIISVMIMRTGCFGHCPTYSVQINNDGTALYSAIRFNKDSGNFIKNIGVDKASAIFDQVRKYKVDTCSDQYFNQIPDLPNLNYEIAYKDKTKKIYSAKYGPDFLSEIARNIEAVGQKKTAAGWKRIPASK